MFFLTRPNQSRINLWLLHGQMVQITCPLRRIWRQQILLWSVCRQNDTSLQHDWWLGVVKTSFCKNKKDPFSFTTSHYGIVQARAGSEDVAFNGTLTTPRLVHGQDFVKNTNNEQSDTSSRVYPPTYFLALSLSPHLVLWSLSLTGFGIKVIPCTE